MLWGWWTELVALELEAFYRKMVQGKRPKLCQYWKKRCAASGSNG